VIVVKKRSPISHRSNSIAHSPHKSGNTENIPIIPKTLQPVVENSPVRASVSVMRVNTVSGNTVRSEAIRKSPLNPTTEKVNQKEIIENSKPGPSDLDSVIPSSMPNNIKETEKTRPGRVSAADPRVRAHRVATNSATLQPTSAK